MAITFNDRSGDERMTLSMDDHGPSLYMSHEGNAGVHIGIVDAGPEGWHVGPFSHFAETREVEAS
jgi:hypothetical protein